VRNQRSCLCQHCSEPRWVFLVDEAFPHTRHNNTNDTKNKHNLPVSLISFILSISIDINISGRNYSDFFGSRHIPTALFVPDPRRNKKCPPF
jgi:hypothetical protein